MTGGKKAYQKRLKKRFKRSRISGEMVSSKTREVGFAQLAAMSQCTETDLGGLAARLPQSTQPELGPVLGFPLRAILPQRMASLSHKSF